MPVPPAYIVLDDDPTGAQNLQDVRVLLDWRHGAQDHEVRFDDLTFILTNTRSMDAQDARSTTTEAARMGSRHRPGARFLLRSDSTLRGHLLGEYLGLSEALHGGRTPPLLLVPALPTAGRVTLDGVHLLEGAGGQVALSETEYARDPVFGYRSSRLLDWAEERSDGFFRALDGDAIPLAELRSGGSDVVVQRIEKLARSDVPAVLAPDAVTSVDLEVIARGLELADARGLETIVRCGPAFVAALAGHAAASHVPMPRAQGGLLVVCGSWVPATTRQLKHLETRFPGVSTQLDLDAIRGGEMAAEHTRLASAVGRNLEAHGLAILATPRERAAWAGDQSTQRLVRSSIVDVVRSVAPLAAVFITKGGITSADVAVEALAEPEALVVGPVEDGVMHWRLGETPAGTRHQLVVPGNVGDDATLSRLVEKVSAPATRAEPGTQSFSASRTSG